MKTKTILTAILYPVLIFSLAFLSVSLFGSCSSEKSSSGCHLTQHLVGYK